MAEIFRPREGRSFLDSIRFQGVCVDLGPILLRTVSRVAGSQRLAGCRLLPFSRNSSRSLFWIDEKKLSDPRSSTVIPRVVIHLSRIANDDRFSSVFARTWNVSPMPLQFEPSPTPDGRSSPTGR